MKRALPLVLLLGSCQFIPGTDASKVAAAEKAVRHDLADEQSARFRNVRVVAGATKEFVCGEVNAKNQFGAYIGFTPFSHNPSSDEAIIYPVVATTNQDNLAIRFFPPRCLPGWKGEAADEAEDEASANQLEMDADNIEALSDQTARQIKSRN